MIYEFLTNPSGEITAATMSTISGGLGPESKTADFFPDSDKYYFDFGTNSLVKKPERPGREYVFDYSSKTWALIKNEQVEWSNVRIKRDALLAKSDWVVLPDVTMDPIVKDNWITYRQALRDITNQPDPFNIIWPTSP